MPKSILFYRMKQLFVLIALTLLGLPVLANQPITIVVPFAVGGSADSLARNVQQTLITNLNRSIVVENRPGASGEIGANYVAKRKQETVLLIASVSLATSNMNRNNLYDLDRDLQPVFYFGHMPLILVTHNQSPVYTLQDLQHSKKIVSYGSSGNGTSSHLTGTELARVLKQDLIHVPYKGVGQAVPDLISGNIDISFMFSSMVIPYAQSGQMRPLAVVSDRRLPQLPQVPTFKELGYENFGFDTWFILLANQGADSQDLHNIRRVLRQTLSNDISSRSYRSLGLEYNIQDFDRANSKLRKEIERYKHFFQLHPELQ